MEDEGAESSFSDSVAFEVYLIIAFVRIVAIDHKACGTLLGHGSHIEGGALCNLGNIDIGHRRSSPTSLDREPVW